MTIALRAGDRGLSFLAHSSPGNGLLACKKRMGISASSSLGCARDDETGKGISPISFQPIAEANLRPFGAPPSIGRRECPREPLPLEGAAERSEAGLASFFAAKPPALSLPPWGRGTASAVDRVLSLMAHLRRSPPLSFIPLVTLSGSLRSPPSPRGEGFVSEIPLSPSNLRPFGAPPSRGRRENAGFPYSKSFSRIVIPKSPSVLWYNMTRRMTRS